MIVDSNLCRRSKAARAVQWQFRAQVGLLCLMVPVLRHESRMSLSQGVPAEGGNTKQASRTEMVHRDSWIMPRFTDDERAMLRSPSPNLSHLLVYHRAACSRVGLLGRRVMFKRAWELGWGRGAGLDEGLRS